MKKPRKRRQKRRLAYYNFGDGPDSEKRQDLEEAYELGVDVIALSEHADRVDVTSAFLRDHPDYDRYYGDGRSGGAKECLLYRKSLGKVTAKKSYTLVGARRVAKGAGPENPGPKVAHRVRMRINGKRTHFTVGHQYATVNNRRDAAWDFINALTDMLRARVGISVFFGDLNAEPRHKLVRALRTLFTGSSSDESGDTHKKRLIDYIMVKGTRIVKVFTQRLTSDHKMVVVDVMI